MRRTGRDIHSRKRPFALREGRRIPAAAVLPGPALHRLTVGATLLRWRLSLPRRYEASSLDSLLISLDTLSRDRRPLSEDSPVTAALLAAERLADRWPWGPKTCLFRALARFATLRSCGVDAVFLMGMARDGGDGHAWIELEGEAFCEDEDCSLQAVTFCYPANAR